jgi:CHAD domain-containing protein
MSADTWVLDLKPKQSAATAARRTVTARLAAVSERLPAAVDRAYEDAEHVHRLRVAGRRAEAVLKAFEELFGKPARRLRRAVRRLRRAAGSARDLDLLLADLARHPLTKTTAPGWHWLTGLAAAERAAAQDALRTAAAEGGPKLDDGLDALADARGGGPVRQLARAWVRDCLEDFDQAVSQDLSDPDALHRARLRAKGTRYAVELFQNVLPGLFAEEVVPLLTSVQDALGAAHDQTAAADWLARQAELARRALPDRWPAWQPAVADWQVRAAREAAAALDRFSRLCPAWRELAPAALEQL